MKQLMTTLDKMVMPEPNTGCWLWTGATNERGYGRSHGHPVHLTVYERMVGPVPEGKELDHLCRVRSCVNPAHLEPVTHRENVLRGDAPPAKHARQTHCRRGHSLIPENLLARSDGRRDCRICSNERARNFRPAMSFSESGLLGANTRWHKEN